MYSTEKRNKEELDCPGEGFSHELKINGIYLNIAPLSDLRLSQRYFNTNNQKRINI